MSDFELPIEGYELYATLFVCDGKPVTHGDVLIRLAEQQEEIERLTRQLKDIRSECTRLSTDNFLAAEHLERLQEKYDRLLSVWREQCELVRDLQAANKPR
jgi:chromosome segregation ATPase